MKIAVSAESTCDLTKELKAKFDIKIIPYKIVLDGKQYVDGDLSVTDIFDYADKHKVLPKTTALNEFEYSEFFQSLLKDYDAVIHIGLSGGLSSSCGNAIRAGKALENVYVVDSESLSTGIALLALKARELADKGMDAKDICEKLEQRKKSLQVSFVIERLDYLYKGGRCNSLQLFGANLLRLRPRIVVKEGVMSSDKKYRGHMDSVVGKYCDDVLTDFDNPDLSRVFVTYTTATPEMVAMAKSACEKAGFKEILETNAGGTIASHCGANTLGILFFNDGIQD